MEEETITRINGNKQQYTTPLPTIVILAKHINEVALEHIYENTGLLFKKDSWGYIVTPRTSKQIATLFMTYNYKTRYYNNGSIENTIYLKSDHHVGFDVDDICYECVKKNHITTRGLTTDSRLAC